MTLSLTQHSGLYLVAMKPTNSCQTEYIGNLSDTLVTSVEHTHWHALWKSRQQMKQFSHSQDHGPAMDYDGWAGLKRKISQITSLMDYDGWVHRHPILTHIKWLLCVYCTSSGRPVHLGWGKHCLKISNVRT